MTFTQNIPIQFLPTVGKRTAHVMHRLGIHTSGQLMRVPESVLVELFGPSIRAVTQQMMPKTLSPQPHTAEQKKRDMSAGKRPLWKRCQLALQVMAVL